MTEIPIFNSPVIVPPEFRLYYDENGRVLFYTCEKPDGKHIIIDALTYAEARPDIRVVDSKIVSTSSNAVVSKLAKADNGIKCATEDVSIIVDNEYTGPITEWKLETHEL
jgi:hypothetical protein